MDEIMMVMVTMKNNGFGGRRIIYQYDEFGRLKFIYPFQEANMCQRVMFKRWTGFVVVGDQNCDMDGSGRIGRRRDSDLVWPF